MNQENNNFNQNFNNQPANEKPAQPVKNKFFNFDFDDNNNVGSAMSNGSHNVISWGVGKKNDNEILDTSNQNQANIETLNESMINQVNSDVYNGSNLEVLEDMPKLNEDYINSVSNTQNNMSNGMDNNGEQFGFASSTLFYETQNTSQETILNQTSMVMPVTQPINEQQAVLVQEQNQNWQNDLNTGNNDWMNNQPLSAASLGGNTLTQENVPADVVEQSRFFNANINDTAKKQEEMAAQYAMQYGNGVGVVLEEPAPVFDEMSLLKEYIGSDFTKLSMSIFSFSTLLLGSIVFLYRKLYFWGITLSCVEASVICFLPINIAGVIILILHIILALMVNPMYMKKAKKVVNSLMKSKKSIKKTQIELNAISYKKGKKSAVKTIILFAVCSLLIYGISKFSDYNVYISKGINFINEKINEILKDNKSSDNDQEKEPKKFDIYDYIDITLPDEFVKVDEESYSYTYVTDQSVFDSSCHLDIKKLDNVKNIEDYMNKLKEKNNILESVGMTTNRGITWYTISDVTEEKKAFYRAAMVLGVPIILEYRIDSQAIPSVCENSYAKITGAISIKGYNEES